MNPAGFFADYDAFGDRRTGGEGDAAAAAWLCDKAASTGAEARLLPAAFTRPPRPRDTGGQRLRLRGALFDGGLRPPDGCRPPARSARRAIGVAGWLPPPACQLRLHQAAPSRHAGIVIALRTKLMASRRSMRMTWRPNSPPVLQLASCDAAAAGAAEPAARPGWSPPAPRPGLSHSIRAELAGKRRRWCCLRRAPPGGPARPSAAVASSLTCRASAGPGRARGVVALATCGHEPAISAPAGLRRRAELAAQARQWSIRRQSRRRCAADGALNVPGLPSAWPRGSRPPAIRPRRWRW